jgi:hypothetical protein
MFSGVRARRSAGTLMLAGMIGVAMVGCGSGGGSEGQTTTTAAKTATTMAKGPETTDAHGHTGDDHAKIDAEAAEHGPGTTDAHGHTGADHEKLEGTPTTKK